MKKTAAIVLAAMILLIFCSIASAGGPTNPHRQEVLNPFRQFRRAAKAKSQIRGQDSYTVDIETPDVFTAGETSTITASVTSSSGGENLRFVWWIVDVCDPDPYGLSYSREINISSLPATDTI